MWNSFIRSYINHIMSIKNIFILCFCVASLMSCKEVLPERKNEKILARVYEKNLYESELKEMNIGLGLSPEDSTLQAQLYINKWVQDQLLYDAAADNIEESPRIKRLVEEYKASLILNEYEQQLLSEHLDTLVTIDEISNYYLENKEQYQRGEDWVRCHFIRISRNVESLDKLRAWFKEDSQKHIDSISMLCAQWNATFQLEDSRWVKLINVTSRLPKDIEMKKHLSGTVLDRTDDDYLYLLKIFEFRDKTDATPMQEVQQEIRRIIIYNREKEILHSLRDDIYKNAKSTGAFEIF